MEKKPFYVLRLIAVALLALSTFSCKDEKEEESLSQDRYECLIVNQGNYSEANGELSLYYKNGTLQNQVYETANQQKLASIIESAVDCGSSWALICNNEDKIEWVDKETFKSVGVLKNITTPRYGAVSDGFLYVTSVTDWYGSDGRVYKIDLSTKQVDTSIVVKGTPEGILIDGNKLFVATGWSYNANTWSSDSTGVLVTDVAFQNPTYCVFDESNSRVAKHLVKAQDGNVYVSLAAYAGEQNGIAAVNTTTQKVEKLQQLPKMASTGHIYYVGGLVYYLAASAGNGAADEETTVVSYALGGTNYTDEAKGFGFYGFGINPKTKQVYTANAEGFATNSILYIYEEADATKQLTASTVGVGACRFYFPAW